MSLEHEIKYLQDLGDDLIGISISLQHPAIPEDCSCIEAIKANGKKELLFANNNTFDFADDISDDGNIQYFKDFRLFAQNARKICAGLGALQLRELELERFYNFSWIPRECFAAITKLTLVEVNTLSGFPFEYLDNLIELILIDCYLFEIPSDILKCKKIKSLRVKCTDYLPEFPPGFCDTIRCIFAFDAPISEEYIREMIGSDNFACEY